MKILLFGGTSEGRRLAEALSRKPVDLTICVATEYAGHLLPDKRNVLVGALAAEEMRALMAREGADLVISAVHPYAAEASANIAAAARSAALPLFRIRRDSLPLPSGALLVSGAEEAADYLRTATGNILLATGVNSLPAFTGIENHADRLYIRILPDVRSLEACLRHGLDRRHILAMQGPFSTELNVSLLRFWSISTLVTKESGDAGGFPQKAEAASITGARLVVLKRPEREPGMTPEEILRQIDSLLEEGP